MASFDSIQWSSHTHINWHWAEERIVIKESDSNLVPSAFYTYEGDSVSEKYVSPSENVPVQIASLCHACFLHEERNELLKLLKSLK